MIRKMENTKNKVNNNIVTFLALINNRPQSYESKRLIGRRIIMNGHVTTIFIFILLAHLNVFIATLGHNLTFKR